MRFDNRPVHPSRVLYVLVPLVSWPFLVGLAGSGANSSAGSPAAADSPSGLTESGGSRACRIEFRTGVNTLDEDAWVVFSMSDIYTDPWAALMRYGLKDLDDSRIAPGERLIAATSRKVSCDRDWTFNVTVRFGSPLAFLATKEVEIYVPNLKGFDRDQITVDLGSPECWAAYEADHNILVPWMDCDTDEEERDADEVVEMGGGGPCRIEFRTGVNTLDEDAWVVFSMSDIYTDPWAALMRYGLKDLDDSRIAPGERLIAATSRKVSCDRDWTFNVTARFGSPLSYLATKEVEIYVPNLKGFDRDQITVDLGSPECWAAYEADHNILVPWMDCVADKEKEEAVQVTGPIRISNFRSGPICDAGDAEIGRPPSDRICEGRDVPVRGKDTCVYNEKEVRCTWWGFEFDYENADPNEPITCIWTRDRAINEGNYEGIRKTGIATDTVSLNMEENRGHHVSYMYDNQMLNAPPWLTVETEYVCKYRGEPLFTATYRMIHTSAFR